MKRNHTLNMFPIEGLEKVDFSFKLIAFDWKQLRYKEEDFYPNLNKLASKIYSKIQAPCVLHYQDGIPFFAIPSNSQLNKQTFNVGPLQIEVNCSKEQLYNVSLNYCEERYLPIIQRFLEFSIRQNLEKNPDLWRFNANQYFLTNPINSKEAGHIDVFGGFRFKVVNEGNRFYLVLDVTYKYLDRHFVSDYVTQENVQSYQKRFKGTRCLYMNGDSWYTIVIQGFANNIDTQEFRNQTIYNYIRSKNAKESYNVDYLLKEDSISIQYKYPGKEMSPHTGAACLAKQIFSTSNPDVKELHNKSALPPYKRFKEITKNIQHFFQDIAFGNVQISINPEPLLTNSQFFKIPDLKFGNGEIISLNDTEEGEKVNIRDFGKSRKRKIRECSIINEDFFDPQYLVVPQSIEREKVKTIRNYLESELKTLAPKFRGFKNIIRYQTTLEKSATHQVEEIKRAFHQQGLKSGFCLFLLPEFDEEYETKLKSLHDCLKNELFPEIKFQCALESEVTSFLNNFPDEEKGWRYDIKSGVKGKFKSYLFNLCLEYLLVNRKWPYALKEDCNYDIYIGIDVQERFAGFTFFYKNGEKIYFDAKKIPKKTGTKRAEKIKASVIEVELIEKLKRHLRSHFSKSPNGIVIIRDGRSYGEEEKALQKVIEQLTQEELVDRDKLQWGVIDLYKESVVPLRIASKTSGHHKLENPSTGVYSILNQQDGFLYNTGFPFEIPGTAKPLHLIYKDGNVDFQSVMQDLFHQSMLAFSAPDRSNALPICIKLIDNMLDPIANYHEEPHEEEVTEQVEAKTGVYE